MFFRLLCVFAHRFFELRFAFYFLTCVLYNEKKSSRLRNALLAKCIPQAGVFIKIYTASLCRKLKCGARCLQASSIRRRTSFGYLRSFKSMCDFMKFFFNQTHHDIIRNFIVVNYVPKLGKLFFQKF